MASSGENHPRSRYSARIKESSSARATRAVAKQGARKSTRDDLLMRNRNIDAPEEEYVLTNPENRQPRRASVEVPKVISEQETLRQRLAKFRDEKKVKKELEKRVKKPAFSVGVVHHSTKYPTLVDGPGVSSSKCLPSDVSNRFTRLSKREEKKPVSMKPALTKGHDVKKVSMEKSRPSFAPASFQFQAPSGLKDPRNLQPSGFAVSSDTLTNSGQKPDVIAIYDPSQTVAPVTPSKRRQSFCLVRTPRVSARPFLQTVSEESKTETPEKSASEKKGTKFNRKSIAFQVSEGDDRAHKKLLKTPYPRSVERNESEDDRKEKMSVYDFEDPVPMLQLDAFEDRSEALESSEDGMSVAQAHTVRRFTTSEVLEVSASFKDDEMLTMVRVTRNSTKSQEGVSTPSGAKRSRRRSNLELGEITKDPQISLQRETAHSEQIEVNFGQKNIEDTNQAEPAKAPAKKVRVAGHEHGPLAPKTPPKGAIKTPKSALKRKSARDAQTPILKPVPDFGSSEDEIPLADLRRLTRSHAKELTSTPASSSKTPRRASARRTSLNLKSQDQPEPRTPGSSKKKSKLLDSSPPVNSVSPIPEKKDVKFFKNLHSSEENRFDGLVRKWEKVLREDEEYDYIPEGFKGEIKATIGQTKMLLLELFRQFATLIDNCEFNKGAQKVLCEDLEGFWDMMTIQIEDLNRRFARLDVLQNDDWVETEKTPKLKKVVRKRKEKASLAKEPTKRGSSLKEFLAAKRKVSSVKPKADVEICLFGPDLELPAKETNGDDDEVKPEPQLEEPESPPVPDPEPIICVTPVFKTYTRKSLAGKTPAPAKKKSPTKKREKSFVQMKHEADDRFDVLLGTPVYHHSRTPIKNTEEATDVVPTTPGLRNLNETFEKDESENKENENMEENKENDNSLNSMAEFSYLLRPGERYSEDENEGYLGLSSPVSTPAKTKNDHSPSRRVSRRRSSLMAFRPRSSVRVSLLPGMKGTSTPVKLQEGTDLINFD